MSEFLDIDTKRLDNCEFQSYKTGLIRKFLKATDMDRCNMF